MTVRRLTGAARLTDRACDANWTCPAAIDTWLGLLGTASKAAGPNSDPGSLRQGCPTQPGLITDLTSGSIRFHGLASLGSRWFLTATMTESPNGRGSLITSTLLASLLAVGNVAHAQEADPRPSATSGVTYAYDAAFEKKQRRLNIAGWTLVGVGVAFPIATGIARATHESKCNDPIECPLWPVSVTSFVLGPVMAAVGGGLLIRRKRLQSKRQKERQQVLISPGLAGLSISGRF